MKDENNCLLLIFTRNPELGKCKTRLAASVGDKTALAIYTFLLQHTVAITAPLKVQKTVYYSDKIGVNDLWDENVYHKKLQEGEDLGQRMANAFKVGFKAGYKRIIVIGSDLFDLSTHDLIAAFDKMQSNDFVLGPAVDGGYYLLGMTRFLPEVFEAKNWGTDSVLKDTLKNLKHENYTLLTLKNDVDVLEDIADIPAFKPFLKNKL
ncbi:TIGR04282 family arsenosugar biosynthesis glycosyltransferase [Muriicola soli]|uniref:Glycosyltransferase n=1 Tax=Muriicola soli TaxID=2507538 RepID=A0A411EDF6_9FLAO|nr:TIGR04282 family arsenosugar biosynthesis glycosyltransferase [Muriicola soli]QBA65659.1 glycosyltransferase [Muriicola soli]